MLFRSDFSKQFDDVFRKCYLSLCNFSCTIVDFMDVSEGLVQDVFADLWERRDEIIFNEEEVEAYLFNKVKESCFKKIKNADVQSVDISAYHESMMCSEVDPKGLNDEGINDVWQAINSLTENRSKILKQVFVEGNSVENVAKNMKVSVDIVETHLNLAHKELRTKLQTSNMFALLALFKIKGVGKNS